MTRKKETVGSDSRNQNIRYAISGSPGLWVLSSCERARLPRILATRGISYFTCIVIAISFVFHPTTFRKFILLLCELGLQL